MAYRGGKTIAPVKTNYGQIAQQYTAGKALVEQERELVRKERSEQLNKLVEESKFAVTGLTDLDNAFLGAANEMRDALSAAHQANIRGESSRGDARAELSNQVGQAQMVANIAELKKNQKDEIQKRVDEGTASQAEMDAWAFDWLPQKDAMPQVIDENGEPRAAVRKVVPKMMKVNGKNQLSFIVQQEYMDENGELQTFTGYRPITEVANPDKKTYAQVDVLSKAKEMLDVVSKKRNFGVDSNGNVITNHLYGWQGSIADTQFKERIFAPETFPDVRRNLEQQLSSLTDEEVVSMIYSFGGGSVLSPNFKGYRSQEEVKNTYSVGDNPLMFDAEFNPVQFESDPLVLEINEEGLGFKVTEDNRKMAQAMLRSQYYIGLDITLDELKGSRRSRSGGKKEPANVPFGSFTYYRPTDVNNPDSQLTNVTVDQNWVKGVITRGTMANKIFSSDSDDPALTQKFVAFNETFSKKGAVSSTHDFSNLDEYRRSLFTHADGSSNVGVEAKTFNELRTITKDKIDVTSLDGFEFKTLTGLVSVNTGDRKSIFFVGDADIANSELAYKKAGGTKAGNMQSALGINKDETFEVMSDRISEQQLQVLWTELYMKNDDFRAWADENEYGQNPGSRDSPDGTYKLGYSDYFDEFLSN